MSNLVAERHSKYFITYIPLEYLCSLDGAYVVTLCFLGIVQTHTSHLIRHSNDLIKAFAICQWDCIVYNERFAGISCPYKKYLFSTVDVVRFLFTLVSIQNTWNAYLNTGHVQQTWDEYLSLYTVNMYSSFTFAFNVFKNSQHTFMNVNEPVGAIVLLSLHTHSICLFHPILSGLPGPGLCSTKQRGECVQPGPHHIQGPGGALWLHSRPPTTDVTGHDCSWEEGRGCRQVCRSTTSLLELNDYCLDLILYVSTLSTIMYLLFVAYFLVDLIIAIYYFLCILIIINIISFIAGGPSEMPARCWWFLAWTAGLYMRRTLRALS